MCATKTIVLPSGPIKANVKDGIIQARGIPYARAGRFERAQKLVHRAQSDVLDCTLPAVICPQNPSRLNKILGDIHVGHAQSEDCLHVSITAPEGVTNRPVMVYFHGGAYLTGGGDLDVYSGTELSRQGGVIVASVSYRVNIFGYLRIPDHAPANLGLLDQIAALEWIRDNVEGFGGNPSDVTIFGQSAGGDSVFCLLLAEKANDLFRRAIIQSAPFGWYFDGRKFAMIETLGQCAKQYLDSVPNPTAQELLEFMRSTLIPRGLEVNEGTIQVSGTELGRDPLPAPGDVQKTLERVAKEKQIMIGWCRDEGTGFTNDDSDPRKGADAITRRTFVDGGEYFHDLIRKVTESSPSYRFLWAPGNTLFGAAHCIELAFILGDWEAWKDAPMLGGEAHRNEVQSLGVQVRKLWIAFASGYIHDGACHYIDGNFVFH